MDVMQIEKLKAKKRKSAGGLESSSTEPSECKHVCQICGKGREGRGQLWQHYVASHFSRQLRQHYEADMDLEQLQCTLCGKRMKSKICLVMHVGTFHLR